MGLALALSGCLIGVAPPAAAQVEARLTEPVKKVLVVREIKTFQAWEYVPPRELEVPATQELASHEEPEAALAAWIGALLAGDERWLERTVSEERWRERAAKPDAERAREGPFLKMFFEGRRLVLSHRAEADDVLLLELSNYDRESGARLLTFLYPLRRIGGSWRVDRQPSSAFFDRLITEFNLADDTLVVDEGFAVLTAEPN